MKEYFNEKWWNKLEYLFEEKEWKLTSLKIMDDVENKKLKVLPNTIDLFNRFKLINYDDVRVVFLTKFPICSYKQSDEWQKLSHQMEQECMDGLWLNVQENLNYLIPQGVINLSESLTINNLNKTYNWWNFNLRVINELLNSGNKILFISNESVLTNCIMHYNQNTYKYQILNLEEGVFEKIDNFMQKEYNTLINWRGENN